MLMQTHNQYADEHAGTAPASDRGVLVVALILVVTVAALMATSVATGTPDSAAAPAAAAGDMPYFPAQFETQAAAAEPAQPVPTF